MAGSGEILVAHGLWEVFRRASQFVPHSVGVYGASDSGKTTLDRQLTTKGEVRPLGVEDRTHHKKSKITGKYVLPEATAKRIKSQGLKKTLVSRDLGGHIEYHNEWLRDMWMRKVKTIVVVLDHRHVLDNRNVENQTALSYLVQSLARNKKPKGLGWKGLFRRRYSPDRIVILANKADLWLDDHESYDLWLRGAIVRHPIFEPYRDSLYDLQEMNIPVYIDACSAAIGWNVDEALFKGITQS